MRLPKRRRKPWAQIIVTEQGDRLHFDLAFDPPLRNKDGWLNPLSHLAVVKMLEDFTAGEELMGVKAK